MKANDVNKCDCTHTQACKICAKSKDIDWNLIEPTERDPKMNDGSYYQIGCVDIKKDLWANINCHNLIDPKTCGRELSCIKCKNFKDNYVRERYPKQEPKPDTSQVEHITNNKMKMKSLTDKIIETLEDRHRHFIGSLATKETIAESEGYRQGLLTAIETIKTLEASAEFDEVTRVVMKHLANPEKYHPHHRVVLNSTHAELLEGKQSTGQVLDYITD